ncbi:hypothetical protein CL614_08320 [archaeon]|nr:hypothetical protein [archaeon]
MFMNDSERIQHHLDKIKKLRIERRMLLLKIKELRDLLKIFEIRRKANAKSGLLYMQERDALKNAYKVENEALKTENEKLKTENEKLKKERK